MNNNFYKKNVLWKWPIAITNTNADLLKLLFTLKNVIEMTRESGQNSIDAYFKNNESETGEFLPLKYNFLKSDEDLSNWFSGLIEAREALSKTGKHGDLYQDDFCYKNMDFLMIQDSNTKGIEGDLESRVSDIWNFISNFGLSNKQYDSSSKYSGSKGIGRLSFPLFSRLGCIFALTKREDGEHLLGLAPIHPYHNKEKNEFYGDTIMFAKEPRDDKSGTWKLHDDLIDKFKKDFKIPKIEYKNEESYGTTIIIPFPKIDEDKTLDDYNKTIKAALLETYGPLILKGEVKPYVNDDEVFNGNIDSSLSNISDYFSSSELQTNGIDFFNFLYNGILENLEQDYEAVIELDEKCKLDASDNKIISTDQKTIIKNALNNNEVVNIKINFPLKKNEESINTYIEVCMKKVAEGHEGFEGYYRNGMLLINQRKFLDKSMHAVMLATDSPILEYLNLFEDAGHTEWKEGEKQKEKAVENGYDKKTLVNALRLCRRVILTLSQIFAERADEANFEVLKNAFTLKEKKQINKNEDKPDIPTNEKKFKIQTRSKGFKLISRDDTKPPKKIVAELKAKYIPFMQKPADHETDADFDTTTLNAGNCKFKVTNEYTDTGKFLFKKIELTELKKDYWFELDNWISKKELSCRFETLY